MKPFERTNIAKLCVDSRSFGIEEAQQIQSPSLICGATDIRDFDCLVSQWFENLKILLPAYLVLALRQSKLRSKAVACGLVGLSRSVFVGSRGSHCALIPIEQREIELHSRQWCIQLGIPFVPTCKQKIGPAICSL